MVRTQVQITEEQAAVLRTLAAERQVSIAELIRMSIDSFLTRETALSRENRLPRARCAVGRFASRTADASQSHDRYLAVAFRESS